MSEEKAADKDGVMIYALRREFLIAAAHSKRNRYEAKHGDEVYYGLAGSEHQFKTALMDLVFPEVAKLSKDQMTRLMADELTGAA